MSGWDLRQAIESAIPVEVYIVIVVVAVVVIAYSIATRGIRK